MSNTKMKGLLKGLRYISQIFDEEKEQEIQIGFPTDVKHVAHIGWDGPSAAAVDSAPSWMKEFKAPGQFQSAPLNGTGDPRENPEIKWVSEDSSSRRSTRSEGEPASIRDLPEVPRSRRHASSENPLGEGSTKSRHSSRRHKGSSEGSKSSRHGGQDSSGAPESPPKKNLPDIPKKSRRKKSKESVNGGSTRSSRSKANNGSAATTYQSPFSDPGNGGSGGPDIGYEYGSKSNKELPSLKPFLEEDQGKGREVVH